MEPLHTKYRPSTFDEVVGQDVAVKSLRRAVAEKASRAFLLTGPSGTGKTTLARIVAGEMGCEPSAVDEIDAATNTGVDDMRAITSQLQYRPLGGGSRALIIDECFAPDTPVDTPEGPRAIASLLTGDRVLGATGVQTIKRVIPKSVSVSSVIKLTLADAPPVVCSMNHPFLTPRGWRDAGRLDGKAILSQEGVKGIPPQLLDLWDTVYEQRRWCAVLRSMLAANMCGLWREIQGATGFAYNLLFSKMWEPIGWPESQGSSSEVLAGRSAEGVAAFASGEPRSVGQNVGRQFCSHAEAQSDGVQRNPAKGDPHQNGEWYASGSTGHTFGTWGKRSRTHGPTTVAVLAYWWCIGVCCLYWAESRAGWLAIQLQTRHRVSRIAHWVRTGWKFTHWSPSPVARSAEGPTAVRARVGRPSLEEFRSFAGYREGRSGVAGTVTLYDLEIVEHPSFCVSGVVAHNCHRLSKQAWDSLLKVIEEPPDYVVWFLCTTEPTKVPKTITTRCFPVDLKFVPLRALEDLLEDVVDAEAMKLADDQIVRLCARQADGSPRQALVYLAACAGASTIKEARELLRTAEESAEAVDLARALVNGSGWLEVRDLLGGLGEVSPESVRHVVRAYVTKVALGAKSEDQAGRCLEILDAFSEPCNASDGISPIVLACGRVVLA